MVSTGVSNLHTINSFFPSQIYYSGSNSEDLGCSDYLSVDFGDSGIMEFCGNDTSQINGLILGTGKYIYYDNK